MGKKIKIGALISGGGTNLQAIIDSCAAGNIDATLVFTGSDNPEAKGLDRARRAGVETFVVDYGKIIRTLKQNSNALAVPDDFDLKEVQHRQTLFSASTDHEKITAFLRSRAIAERALLDYILPHDIDLLVLAGFMRTLTPYFIDHMNTVPGKWKIMNIHPALLPSFPGTDGYGDTFRHGCKVGGCTVHFIDYGEDTGPIIGQRAFEITDEDTLESIKKKGLALEWALYPECIQKFAENKI
ncbi:formyltetrahydrofolate-dependent phosphoribosylglycinamide formyltransferase [Desulfocicer vacuolatum DSM 3385]|uniref:Phosphoribosylglycinamide formyltransferase n=1 Tax=Desulfocicer vacuolatum DSM 3385 TaxID=1121400 RepID=A0A1W2CJ60_9BACT|nr:phosphoribosylglycinamide formyltransferase [Desulfocicer vacuolatum]SMC84668.1 formyltetrahydrofolate-dependent phosphoribosylglycinamide formyltransferase [Desulfocicer vacuolatum DSM 3385]